MSEKTNSAIPYILSVNGKEYQVIKLLGKGKGEYSDLVKNNDKSYVLKQIHHETCSYYQFGNKIEAEIHDYERLKNSGIRIPLIVDVDIPNERILKDYIKGETVFDLIKNDKIEERYLEQIKKMCVLLYANNTNIDNYPTNFVVQDGLIFYIDYECNNYSDEWNFENWGINYWPKT